MCKFKLAIFVLSDDHYYYSRVLFFDIGRRNLYFHQAVAMREGLILIVA